MTTWEAVLAAVTTALGGDRDAGRAALTEGWAGTGDSEHAQRCVLAHYLADVQGDLDDEIGWDETALHHYPDVADDALAAVGIPSAAALAPSLHLNLGDGYLRRGDILAARKQVDAGRAALGALGDDGYGALVRQGIERLAERVARAEQDGSPG